MLSSRLFLFSCFLHPRSGGGGILPSNRLMGMCRWIDYNGVTFSPGAPLTYFNDGGVRQRFIFYTQKNPNFRICLPKKIPTFFSIPKKIPQCFCISKFYYLSSGKLKHANFNFGFGRSRLLLVLVKNKTINCAYVIFDLSWWKIQYPKKSLCCFRDPKKNLGHWIWWDLHSICHAMDTSAGFLLVFGLIGLGHFE